MTMRGPELFEWPDDAAGGEDLAAVASHDLFDGGVVRSVYGTNAEILTAIEKLHCPEGFECDMTFGNGAFWKGRARPKYCFDITPLHDGVIEATSEMLPLEPSTLANAVFDPPFLTYVKAGRAHKDGKVAMTARFGGYYTYDELEDHYRGTISEAWRVLKPGGKLIFKCQDVIHNHRMHCTHVNVCNWAEIEGFRLLDLFILPAKSRMPGPQKGTQRHARVFHSYFLVFVKPGRLIHPSNKGSARIALATLVKEGSLDVEKGSKGDYSRAKNIY